MKVPGPFRPPEALLAAGRPLEVRITGRTFGYAGVVNLLLGKG